MEKRIIKFDPVLHRYTDEYKIPYTSVTQLIGKVEPTYNSRFWAMYRVIEQVVAYKPRPFLETEEIEISYVGKRVKIHLDLLYGGFIPTIKPPEDVITEWEEIKDQACEWGSSKHEYLENCINQFSVTNHIDIATIRTELQSSIDTRGFAMRITSLEELEKSPLRHTYTSIFECIKKFVVNSWTVFAEKRVYSAYHRIAGTIDVLLVKDGMFYILDWKTNRKALKFESGYYKKVWNQERTKKVETSDWVRKDDRFLNPLSHIQHCKGETYTLQLSLYAYLCELWGLRHMGTILCHIRPACTEQGEILIDKNGWRIEVEPEFYDLNDRKADAHILAEWNRKQFLN